MGMNQVHRLDQQTFKTDNMEETFEEWKARMRFEYHVQKAKDEYAKNLQNRMNNKNKETWK
jgi:hypothetical protein